MASTKRSWTGMPGWVKVFLWVGVAALAVALIAGLSGHGPWQHMAGAVGQHATAGMHS